MICLRPGGLALTEEILSFCQLSQDSAALDIGCGNGETIKYIKEQYNCRVSGLEPDRARRQAAQELNPDAEISNQAAEAMPFADSSFDLVLSECTVSLFTDVEQALSQIKRVLKPGGKFILTDVYARLDNNLQAEGLLRHMYTEQQFRDMLAAAGLTISVVKDCGDILKEMLLDMVFEYGRDKAYQMIGLDRCVMKQAGVGYLMIVAEK